MVTILTPLSIPTDIQQQTIYTVVSKPVRRLELVWGRMLGYMALVTGLILVFGVISLFYLWRTVGLTIQSTETAAIKAQQDGRPRDFNQLKEQADQLRSRMAARVPVKGSLSFLDSRGTPHAMGIDVGQEQSMREPRSHIEGATPATAVTGPSTVVSLTDDRVVCAVITVSDTPIDSTSVMTIIRRYVSTSPPRAAEAGWMTAPCPSGASVRPV